MNKTELASRVSDVLRETGKRKPVRIEKHTFHISDDEGHSTAFTVKKKNKTVAYTSEDALAVIDACISVMLDAISRGEEIKIIGVGKLYVHKRVGRMSKDPNGEWCEIESRYIPKMSFGDSLKRAARLYEIRLKEAEGDPGEPAPFYTDEELDKLFDDFDDMDDMEDADDASEVISDGEC